MTYKEQTYTIDGVAIGFGDFVRITITDDDTSDTTTYAGKVRRTDEGQLTLAGETLDALSGRALFDTVSVDEHRPAIRDGWWRVEALKNLVVRPVVNGRVRQLINVEGVPPDTYRLVNYLAPFSDYDLKRIDWKG